MYGLDAYAFARYSEMYWVYPSTGVTSQPLVKGYPEWSNTKTKS